MATPSEQTSLMHEERARSTLLPVAVAVSLAVHAAVYVRLVPAPRLVEPPLPPARVELLPPPTQEEITPHPSPEHEPVASPDPLDVPVKPVEPHRRTLRPSPAAEAAMTPAADDAASEPEPMDFTALTLTSGTATGRAGVAPGVRGGATTPRRAATMRRRAGLRSRAEETSAARPPVVGLSELARRPVPPDLDASLQQNYPVAARRSGLSGTASLKIRIAPNGKVAHMSTISASSPAFEEACRKTLAGSRWSPPEDAAGRRVYTDLTYTCRFSAR